MSTSRKSINIPNNKMGQEILFTEKYEWSEASLLFLLQEIALKWCSGCPKKYSILLNDFLPANSLPTINFPDSFFNLSPINTTDVLAKEISNALANLQIKSNNSPTSNITNRKPPTAQVSNVYNKHKWADLQSSRSLQTSPIPSTGFQLYVSGANSSTSTSLNHLTVAVPPTSPNRKNTSRRSVSPNLQAPQFYPSHSTVNVKLGNSSENNQNKSNDKTIESKNAPIIMNDNSINGHLQNCLNSMDVLNQITLPVSNNTSLEPIAYGIENSDSEEMKILEIEKAPTGKPPIIRRSSGSDFNCIVTKIPDPQKASLVKVSINDESVLNKSMDTNNLNSPTKIQNIDLVSSTVIERAYAKTVSLEDIDKVGMHDTLIIKNASEETNSIELGGEKYTTEMCVGSFTTAMDTLVSDGKTNDTSVNSTIPEPSKLISGQILKDESQTDSSDSSIKKEINSSEENVKSGSIQMLCNDSLQICKSNDNIIVSKVSTDKCESTILGSNPITSNKNSVTTEMMNESIENYSCESVSTTKTSEINNSDASLESLSDEKHKLESGTVTSLQQEGKESKSAGSSSRWIIATEPNISTYIVQMLY